LDFVNPEERVKKEVALCSKLSVKISDRHPFSVALMASEKSGPIVGLIASV
jgi:hypothetical protein